MSGIPPSLRADVERRAGGRCEYCRLSQLGQEATFHIDHVVPRAGGGPTAIENLALACGSRSLLTPTARVTTAALALNRPLIVAIREEESARGRHPPA